MIKNDGIIGDSNDVEDEKEDGEGEAESVTAPTQGAQEELNEFEENIRLNITENELLLEETLNEIVPLWWNQEPFRWVIVFYKKIFRLKKSLTMKTNK